MLAAPPRDPATAALIAADWRFLLPALPHGQVLCIGGAEAGVPLALAATSAAVVALAPPRVLAPQQEAARAAGYAPIHGLAGGSRRRLLAIPPGAFDLVAVLRPAPGMGAPPLAGSGLASLAQAVAPGGTLYLEIARPALLVPPARLRRRLAGLGFGRVRTYWPKPTFARCELFLPLGDRRFQCYYLAEVFFAMSPARRLLRRGLAALVAVGLFEWTLPGYAVVATRAGDA